MLSVGLDLWSFFLVFCQGMAPGANSTDGTVGGEGGGDTAYNTYSQLVSARLYAKALDMRQPGVDR